MEQEQERASRLLCRDPLRVGAIFRITIIDTMPGARDFTRIGARRLRCWMALWAVFDAVCGACIRNRKRCGGMRISTRFRASCFSNQNGPGGADFPLGVYIVERGLKCIGGDTKFPPAFRWAPKTSFKAIDLVQMS